MHHTIILLTYGFLALTGTLHFAIDVVSQHLRCVREPGRERTLYYRLHTSYALGQVALGLTGVALAQQAPDTLDTIPLRVLTIAAASAWLAVSILFIEYRPPKINAATFLALALATLAF